MAPPRGPLAPFLREAPPTAHEALGALRFVHAVVFMAQVGLASGVGFALAAVGGGRANDVFAGVLLVASLLMIPIAAALGVHLSRRPGRGPALAAQTATTVVSSSTGWFAALILASGQRPIAVAAGFALVAVAYSVGFALTPRCARAAVVPASAPASADAP